MESYSKFFKLCLIAMFLYTAASANAQQMTASQPGPEIKSTQPNVEIRNQQDQPVSHEPIAQTDEYGYFNFNAILGGLGSTGGYVAVPGAFNENVDGSIEAWVYPTQVTGDQAIVAKGDNTNVGFYFGIQATTAKLFIRFGNGVSVSTGTSVPVNTWSHVACTWTGGAGNYSVAFYLNGALNASMTNTGTWNVTADSLTIGNSRSGFSGTAFFGNIDEVRYWTDQRTAVEIRDNRFVGIGDGANANSGSALTSSSHYAGCNNMWNFNTGGNNVDYIGGLTGYMRAGAGAFYSAYAPQPIPYNYVGVFPFGANDYVTVPDNAAFNLSTQGSAEAWVYPTGQTTTHMILSRGTTGFNFFWGVRQSIGNKQAVDIGAGPQFQNSDGVAIPINQWSHVAISWVQSGGNYVVTFFVNGKQSGTPQVSATTWNSTSGTLRIGGWHGGTANHWNGKIDEVRIWNVSRNAEQVKQNMFASGRGLLPNANLIGVWNFDGNLNNFSAVAGINGSYNTGGTNNCYLSAFGNETNTGALSNSFEAYATVVNRGGSPNPFPTGYIIKAPSGKVINDNQSTFDTISVSGSAALTSLEVFIAIRHTYCGDLSITIKSPNGQTRDLSSGNGGTGLDILTFFVDGGTAVTTASFYPPWTPTAGPEVAMGNMGGTNIQGNWILQVADGAGGDTGEIIGWGLRFNGAVTGIEPVSNSVPGSYALYQNYPNPFNPTTNIKFDLAKASNVKLVVYDILGREVRTLVNEFKNPGAYELKFDASNLASGTYFYRIEAGDFVEIKKMVLVK